jgi:hypothetical protein
VSKDRRIRQAPNDPLETRSPGQPQLRLIFVVTGFLANARRLGEIAGDIAVHQAESRSNTWLA